MSFSSNGVVFNFGSQNLINSSIVKFRITVFVNYVCCWSEVVCVFLFLFVVVFLLPKFLSISLVRFVDEFKIRTKLLFS